MQQGLMEEWTRWISNQTTAKGQMRWFKKPCIIQWVTKKSMFQRCSQIWKKWSGSNNRPQCKIDAKFPSIMTTLFCHTEVMLLSNNEENCFATHLGFRVLATKLFFLISSVRWDASCLLQGVQMRECSCWQNLSFLLKTPLFLLTKPFFFVDKTSLFCWQYLYFLLTKPLIFVD